MRAAQPRRGQTMTPTSQKAPCRAPTTNGAEAIIRVGASSAGQTRDPVCGMVVDPVTAKHRADQNGLTHYFCCGGCKAKFLANPALYPKSAEKTATAVPDAATASP